jgi:hypothetical protein
VPDPRFALARGCPGGATVGGMIIACFCNHLFEATHSTACRRAPDDLRRFVRSPEHLRIMREYRDTGASYTNACTADRFDPELIWRQGRDRLAGRVEGVPHH